jgi:glucosamine kinase
VTPATGTLVADVGRTTCRVQVGERSPIAVPSGASLADRHGAVAVADALRRAVEGYASDPVLPELRTIVVGVTGAAQAPAAADELASELQRRSPRARVMVTSDVVTAHVGALGGLPGVVTIAGTGAVALGVGADGAHHLVDGHGPYLGDAGGGVWIARHALDAALRHHDGRPGGSPTLAAAAAERFGALEDLVPAIQGAAHPWRELAGFVPDVVAAALAGDVLAGDLFAAAVTELAATTRAAARAAATSTTSGPSDPGAGPAVPASLLGGLADQVELVRDPLARVLARTDDGCDGAPAPAIPVQLVPAAGDALTGAWRLAELGAGAHHHLVRDRPVRTSDTRERI